MTRGPPGSPRTISQLKILKLILFVEFFYLFIFFIAISAHKATGSRDEDLDVLRDHHSAHTGGCPGKGLKGQRSQDGNPRDEPSPGMCVTSFQP